MKKGWLFISVQEIFFFILPQSYNRLKHLSEKKECLIFGDNRILYQNIKDIL